MNWRWLAAACIGIANFVSPAAAQTTITVDASDEVAISPLLYGTNYVWNRIPADEFPTYQTAMNQVAHATLSRYLGGWGAEAYDWSQNIETGKQAAMDPGEAPDAFLSAAPTASFVTPSAAAIADPNMIPAAVQLSAGLVQRYGGRVKYWEIGNEWWLQAGAKTNPARRQRNLAAYADLLAAVAPAMKAINPNIVIFATIDWAQPQDAAVLRDMTGPAWAAIDGISIHPYCGTEDASRLCGSLPAAAAAIRAASGKQSIYASEWSVTRNMNVGDEGIANADLTVMALQDLALAGVNMAAYWPPVKILPEIAFVSNDYQTPYPTGVAFGWMASEYEGMALQTSGPVAAVAARDGDKLTVIVPSWGTRGTLRVQFNGFPPLHVRSAQIISEVQGAAAVATLPVSTGQANGQTYVEFDVNPGGDRRGSAYEIARVTLGS